MVVRPAAIDDVPAIVGLLGELAQTAHEHAGGMADSARIAELFAEMAADPIYFTLVAVVDHEVSGFIAALFYRSLFHSGGTALINDLAVRADRRGRGIGRALVSAVVAEARNRGLDEVEVSTEAANTRARRFYEATGFDREYVLLGMEFE